MTIETQVSGHARRQAQQRGNFGETRDLVLIYIARKLLGSDPALWTVPPGAEAPALGWSTIRTDRAVRGRARNR
jgi:hypothetical protein